MDKFDVAVIGAGVVGLAIAREFAINGKKVIVFERNPSYGAETSSRGSGVIHSGIYYDKKTQPLKASLCVQGNPLLYEYAKAKKILHKKLGKIIVATDNEEAEKIDKLRKNGINNGVNDLEELSEEQVRTKEPHVKCIKGLYSPSTGIVDPLGLMNGLKMDFEDKEGVLRENSPVAYGEVTNEGIVLDIEGTKPERIIFSTVINSAGLNAIEVARNIQGLDKKHIPENNYSKGYYYRLKGQSPFHHLIYPLPVQRGLGIHATLDIENNTRFGPNNEQVKNVDYAFIDDQDESRKELFVKAIKRYYPSIMYDLLKPDHTGIRPQISFGGFLFPDFVIQGKNVHNIPRLINLFGIESPALTSSLAIANYVYAMAENKITN